MYLTRIMLDLHKRKTQIALFSPEMLHGAIERSFSGKQERNLWRIDTLNNKTYLLLLSKELPDLHDFTIQFGYDDLPVETKNYDRLLNRVVNESFWQFRLVANPTHSVKSQQGRGRVFAHITPQYQLKWLIDKSKNNGFEVIDDSCSIKSSEWKSFNKTDNNGNSAKKNHRVRLYYVTYEGILKVTDENSFRQALVSGIGRGKAYGAGMMTLIRI